MLHDLDNPTLAELHRRARRLTLDFEALAAPLTLAQLQWSPAPGRWGIAECLEHLTLTGSRSESEVERALDSGRGGRVTREPLRRGVLGRWLIDAAGPADRARPLRCPATLHPGRDTLAGALARFRATQDRLLALLEAADGLDINATRVRVPAHPLVRLRLGEAFELAVAHGERHLAQARRVRADARFPAPG